MKYKYIIILLSLTILNISCQSLKNDNKQGNSISANLESEFNLHCEYNTYGHLPDGRWKWGSTENYSMKRDTTEYIDGKQSIKLSLNDNSNKESFAAATYRIHAIYSGKKLVLTHTRTRWIEFKELT